MSGPYSDLEVRVATSPDRPDRGLVLVTGASGYIGSHAASAFVDAGWCVRASARSVSRIPSDVRERVDEVVSADAFDPVAVRESLEGVSVALYLIHTLGAGPEYAERDRRAAEIFAAAASDAGVERIVYLGGLGRNAGGLSEHLASRQEVGRVLASRGVPVIELRASIVIGGGSTSFEMIRNLVEKLPVMTTPRWVRMDAQPIAVADVTAYLIAVAECTLPAEDHRVYEIGGADVVTYGDLLRLYGHIRGLKRLVIPVPFLSPGLSGWWLYLFTPRQATVGRQLAESLRYPTAVTDDAARADFPWIVPVGAVQAVEDALSEEARRLAQTRWSRELSGAPNPAHATVGGCYVDSRCIRTACPPEAAFDPIACIGGEKGWYAFDTLWDIRGFLDLLVGGPGHRRGRRDQYALIEGDYLEWWRVERVEAPTLLRLHAEMRMPGEGWLQYELDADDHGTVIRQTAIFNPKGVLGKLYWYAVLPFHHFVFNGTLEGINRECTALVEGPDTCPLPGEWARQAATREP